MSYPCCDHDCEFCGEQLCRCTCQAAKDKFAEFERRVQFMGAVRIITETLIDIDKLLREHGEHKLITLQFTPHGDRFTGQLRMGMARGDVFGDPLALWDILSKIREEKL